MNSDMNRIDRIEEYCKHIGVDVDLRDCKSVLNDVEEKRQTLLEEVAVLHKKINALHRVESEALIEVMHRTKEDVIAYLETIEGIQQRRDKLSQCIEEGVIDTDTADDLRLEWFRQHREKNNYKQYQSDPRKFSKAMEQQYRNRM